MFAVIKTGGKQYKVSKDQVLTVNKIEGNAGDSLTITEVLAVGGDKPLALADAAKSSKVTAEIVEQFREDTVIIFKKKRRQNYRRKNGHRQKMTSIRITGISA